MFLLSSFFGMFLISAKVYFGETLCIFSKRMNVRRSLLSICCQPSVKPVHYFTSIILFHIDWPVYTDTWYDTSQCLWRLGDKIFGNVLCYTKVFDKPETDYVASFRVLNLNYPKWDFWLISTAFLYKIKQLKFFNNILSLMDGWLRRIKNYERLKAVKRSKQPAVLKWEGKLNITFF